MLRPVAADVSFGLEDRIAGERAERAAGIGVGAVLHERFPCCWVFAKPRPGRDFLGYLAQIRQSGGLKTPELILPLPNFGIVPKEPARKTEVHYHLHNGI